MVRASGHERHETGVWMEPSHRPTLDHSGRVLIFSLRHLVDDQDAENDDDLYVWLRGPRAAGSAPEVLEAPLTAVSVDIPDSVKR